MPSASDTVLRIAVLDDFQQVARSLGQWSSIPNSEMVSFPDHVGATDELVARLADFDVVCLMRERTRMSAEVLSRLPRLKLIVTTGMWNANLDVSTALGRGLTVCGTQSTAQAGTPELTVLLMLALARQLPRELQSIARGGWQSSVGRDLEGRTLGILGLGIIGKRVAAVANAFGMRVLAWSQNLTAEAATAAGATLVSKDELLRASDFITLHMKLSERSRGLLGTREFDLMKPSAYVINTSRGPLISEAALVEALRSKRIAGAGLDVFDVEPLPADHPLRTLPNVIATPHIGYVTDVTYEGFYRQIVENIRAWAEGVPVRTLGPEGGALFVA